MAELRGWTQFVGLQIRYSLIDRTAERDLLPMAREFDIAVTPWSVLGAGVLSGKYNKDRAATGRAQEGAATIERNLEIAAAVMQMAEQIGCSPSQVAVSWARQQAGVVIPIIGARNTEQLEDNLGALEVTLSQEQLAELDGVSKIELGFPHDFLGSEQIRDIVYGGTQGVIDNHRI